MRTLLIGYGHSHCPWVASQFQSWLCMMLPFVGALVGVRPQESNLGMDRRRVVVMRFGLVLGMNHGRPFGLSSCSWP